MRTALPFECWKLRWRSLGETERPQPTKKPRSVSHALRGSYLLVEVSQSHLRNASAASNIQKGVPFAIAWALRKPGEDVSTALTRGDAQRGTISLRQRSIHSRRKQRGSKTGERGFAICRSTCDRRSRNVLEHRPSAKRITSPTDRRVRAETVRCRTATLVESLSPNGNGSTQTSRNLGSARTWSGWFGIFPKAPISARSSGPVRHLRDDALSRFDNSLWIRVADSKRFGPSSTLLAASR